MKTIVLASASPRREELLKKIGLEFKIEPSNSQEDISFDLEPHELGKSLSLEKARLVAQKHHNAIIIAADTFIFYENKILGKPGTKIEARQMLEKLNGKQHLVITGFSIIDTNNGKTLSKTVETKVYFKNLSPDEIEAYVDSEEPLGKAGGYAIQGLGSVIVDKIEGDYFNVIGLPLSALAESLKEFDIRVLQNRSS